MNKSLLRDAFKIAVDYIPKHPEYKCYMHYSFIIQSGKIIEWDTNSNCMKFAPLYAMYASRVADLNNGIPKCHSEPAAYQKAKGLLVRNKSFDLVNIRVNKKGLPRCAAPCVCCMQFLSSLNCRKIWFTTDVGWAKLITD
jgi:hypothetical protein